MYYSKKFSSFSFQESKTGFKSMDTKFPNKIELKVDQPICFSIQQKIERKDWSQSCVQYNANVENFLILARFFEHNYERKFLSW